MMKLPIAHLQWNSIHGFRAHLTWREATKLDLFEFAMFMAVCAMIVALKHS